MHSRAAIIILGTIVIICRYPHVFVFFGNAFSKVAVNNETLRHIKGALLSLTIPAEDIFHLVYQGLNRRLKNSDHLGGIFTACRCGSSTIVLRLLLAGVSPDVRNEKQETPLFDAVRKEAADIAALLLSHGADPDARDRSGRTPLSFALAGRGQKTDEIVRILLAGGANDVGDLKALSRREISRAVEQAALHEKIEILRVVLSQSRTVPVSAMSHALSLAVLGAGRVSEMGRGGAIAMGSTEKDWNEDAPCPVHDIIAELLKAGADPNPAVYHAVVAGNLSVLSQLIDGGAAIRLTGPSRNLLCEAANRPRMLISTRLSEVKIQKELEKNLSSMVGIENFIRLFAFDLAGFFAERKSRGRIIWGSSGVGKTEIAQRLSGNRSSIPGLQLGEGQVNYITGVDGKLDIKHIVDQIPPMSILFIDEADKCLDPEAGMVDNAEAIQLRHSIVSHFERKPVYWILLGSFEKGRGGGKLTDRIVQRILDKELSHRFDYVDWMLPDWTLENLLKVVDRHSWGRKLRYEDEAALRIAQYCVESRGGVRAFENIESSILRHYKMRQLSDHQTVSSMVVESMLAKRT